MTGHHLQHPDSARPGDSLVTPCCGHAPIYREVDLSGEWCDDWINYAETRFWCPSCGDGPLQEYELATEDEWRWVKWVEEYDEN